MHVDHRNHPALIGDDVTVGHAAIIHACRLGNHAFIGMGATVLDGAVVEEGGMLGARGLLGPGKRIGAQELWIGAPARLVRRMSDAERAGWDETVPHYVELAKRHPRQRALTAVCRQDFWLSLDSARNFRRGRIAARFDFKPYCSRLPA